MIAGSMLVLNLFIGVVIDNFNKIKESEEVGNLFVTDAQRNWMEMQHLMLSKNLQLKKKLPSNRCKQKLYTIVNSNKFDYVIIFIIFLNTCTMSLKYYRMN